MRTKVPKYSSSHYSFRYNLPLIIVAIAGVIRSVISISITTVIVCSPKYDGQGDDEGECRKDIVDKSGNITANSNGTECFSSVPLFGGA